MESNLTKLENNQAYLEVAASPQDAEAVSHSLQGDRINSRSRFSSGRPGIL